MTKLYSPTRTVAAITTADRWLRKNDPEQWEHYQQGIEEGQKAKKIITNIEILATIEWLKRQHIPIDQIESLSLDQLEELTHERMLVQSELVS